MKNLYNSHEKIVNLLIKFVLILLLYAVTCHATTVTNCHFMWCSVVINVICNTYFSSISCYIGKFYFEVFLIVILNYLGGSV
jgi:hypothetical protein